MEIIETRGRKPKYDIMPLLADIYRMRALTIKQIADVFFGGRKPYVYKKLKSMQKDGLIADMPHNEKGGRMIQKLYYVTDAGISLLQREGYITGKVRLERRNKPEKSKVDYLILTNNIYAVLKQHRIEMIDSRQWKSDNNLDRNAMVRGGVIITKQEQYGLYAFFNEIGEKNSLDNEAEPDEEYYIGQKTIKRFLKELENMGNTHRYICLIYGRTMYEQLENAIKSHKPSVLQLNLVPYGKNGLGYDMICAYEGLEAQKNRFQRISGIRPLNKTDITLNSENQHFFSYIGLDSTGHEVYVVDYLLMNIIALQALHRLYSYDQYLRDGRKVYLFCWEPAKSVLKEEFQAYPHIEIVPIPMKMAKEWKDERTAGSQKVDEVFSL